MRRIFIALSCVVLCICLSIPCAFADSSFKIAGYGQGIGVGSVKTMGKSYGWYGGVMAQADIQYITYEGAYNASGVYEISYHIQPLNAIAPGSDICYIPICVPSGVSVLYDITTNGYSKTGIPIMVYTCPSSSYESGMTSLEISEHADGYLYCHGYGYNSSGCSYFVAQYPSDAVETTSTVTITVRVSGLESPLPDVTDRMDFGDFDDMLTPGNDTVLYPFETLADNPVILTSIGSLIASPLFEPFLKIGISALAISLIVMFMR